MPRLLGVYPCLRIIGRARAREDALRNGNAIGTLIVSDHASSAPTGYELSGGAAGLSSR